MIPLEKVKNIIDKHSKLETDLSSNSIDKKKFAEMSKEYSDINEIIEDAKFYIVFEVEKKELEKSREETMMKRKQIKAMVL